MVELGDGGHGDIAGGRKPPLSSMTLLFYPNGWQGFNELRRVTKGLFRQQWDAPSSVVLGVYRKAEKPDL